MADKTPLMTLNEVREFTTYSKTQILKLRAEGKFPVPVSLGVKRIAFVREEIEQWYADRLAERERALSANMAGAT